MDRRLQVVVVLWLALAQALPSHQASTGSCLPSVVEQQRQNDDMWAGEAAGYEYLLAQKAETLHIHSPARQTRVAPEQNTKEADRQPQVIAQKEEQIEEQIEEVVIGQWVASARRQFVKAGYVEQSFRLLELAEDREYLRQYLKEEPWMHDPRRTALQVSPAWPKGCHAHSLVCLGLARMPRLLAVVSSLLDDTRPSQLAIYGVQALWKPADHNIVESWQFDEQLATCNQSVTVWISLSSEDDDSTNAPLVQSQSQSQSQSQLEDDDVASMLGSGKRIASGWAVMWHGSMRYTTNHADALLIHFASSQCTLRTKSTANPLKLPPLIPAFGQTKLRSDSFFLRQQLSSGAVNHIFEWYDPVSHRPLSLAERASLPSSPKIAAPDLFSFQQEADISGLPHYQYLPRVEPSSGITLEPPVSYFHFNFTAEQTKALIGAVTSHLNYTCIGHQTTWLTARHFSRSSDAALFVNLGARRWFVPVAVSQHSIVPDIFELDAQGASLFVASGPFHGAWLRPTSQDSANLNVVQFRCSVKGSLVNEKTREADEKGLSASVVSVNNEQRKALAWLDSPGDQLSMEISFIGPFTENSTVAPTSSETDCSLTAPIRAHVFLILTQGSLVVTEGAYAISSPGDTLFFPTTAACLPPLVVREEGTTWTQLEVSHLSSQVERGSFSDKLLMVVPPTSRSALKRSLEFTCYLTSHSDYSVLYVVNPWFIEQVRQGANCPRHAVVAAPIDERINGCRPTLRSFTHHFKLLLSLYQPLAVMFSFECVMCHATWDMVTAEGNRLALSLHMTAVRDTPNFHKKWVMPAISLVPIEFVPPAFLNKQQDEDTSYFFPYGTIRRPFNETASLDWKSHVKTTSDDDTAALQWLDEQQRAQLRVVAVSYGGTRVYPPQVLSNIVTGILEASSDLSVLVSCADHRPASLFPPHSPFLRSPRVMLVPHFASVGRLLTHPAVVLSAMHSGFNSVADGLAASQPMLAVPTVIEWFEDQLRNSQAVEEIGAGLFVNPFTSTNLAADVAAAVRQLTGPDRPKYVEAVQRYFRTAAEKAQGRSIFASAAQYFLRFFDPQNPRAFDDNVRLAVATNQFPSNLGVLASTFASERIAEQVIL